MGDGGFPSFVLRKGITLPPPKAVFLVYLTGGAFCWSKDSLNIIVTLTAVEQLTGWNSVY